MTHSTLTPAVRQHVYRLISAMRGASLGVYHRCGWSVNQLLKPLGFEWQPNHETGRRWYNPETGESIYCPE